MVLPTVFLINDATLASRKQSFDLKYKEGITVFNVGAIVEGVTSGAKATIISTGGVVSGTLKLHTITGTFQNNEVIVDDGTVPGNAKADGTLSESVDAYGELVYITITSSIKCRFTAAKKKMVDGMMIASLPRVLLAPTVSVSENDTLTSTDTGFAETFGIKTVKAVYEAATKEVSHFSCEIGAVI
jgi:hypothetical protein